MRFQKVLAVFALVALVSGCATMSNRTKTILLTGVAGTAAFFVGQATAPSGTNPQMHGVFWSGLAMTGSAIGGQFIFDEQKRADQAEVKSAELEKVLRGGFGNERKLVGEYNVMGNKPLPSRLSMVKPGNVMEYEVDLWDFDSETHGFHKDREIEVIPPVLGAIEKGVLHE